MENLLTKKELLDEFRKQSILIRADIKEIVDMLLVRQGKKLDIIQHKLEKFLSILDRYERKQRILEKKMRAIEEYFEHRN